MSWREPPLAQTPSVAGGGHAPGHARSASSTSTRLAACGIQSPVLWIALNQDNSCFAIGMEGGFRVYSTDPLRELLRREFDEGGIGMVSMLFRTNIMALVGGGKNPRFAPNKVILFDERLGKTQAELEFRSEVKRVLLIKERMIVVLKSKIYLYTLDKRPRQLQVIETIENPMGIAAISNGQDGDTFWLAYPGLQVGQICLLRINTTGETGTNSLVIAAHKSPVAALALNRAGTLLASASEKGTLVRVHEVRSGRLRYELRRGADRAFIYDIAFNMDSSLVAVSSDKGTVHIFSLPNVETSFDGTSPTLDPSLQLANRQSSLAFIKEMLPKYFASQWSFAQCRVGECRSTICFGADPSTIYVITVDGHFYRFRFDLLGGRTGECIKEFQSKFISTFYE